MSPRPDPGGGARSKFGRWLAAVRILLVLAALADLTLFRSSIPAACCALAACLPLERRGFPAHLLGLPAAAMGAWSIHRTGVEAASGLQMALFVLPLMVSLLGTLRAEAPLY